MGYRSAVAYLIKFATVLARDGYVAYLSNTDDRHLKTALTEVDYSHPEPIITFKAEYVKWYDFYEDVQAHQHIYRHAAENCDAAYRFVAVGEDGREDYECHEVEGIDIEDYIYTVHTIETSF